MGKRKSKPKVNDLVAKNAEKNATEAAARAEKDEPKTVKRKPTQFQKVVGRHERKGRNVATVMTQAASEVAETAKKHINNTTQYQNCLHKPYGDE